MTQLFFKIKCVLSILNITKLESTINNFVSEKKMRVSFGPPELGEGSFTSKIKLPARPRPQELASDAAV
jgi:hypothetical protein